MKLDVEFCRSFFPPIKQDLIYFENAGGSYVPRQVIDKLSSTLSEAQSQPGWGYSTAREADRRIEESKAQLAECLNVSADSIIIGPSTTLNVYVLAQALSAKWAPGDEVVVTNQDHEANSGAWRRLAERGIVVREWRINPVTGDLDPKDLTPLLNSRTRLVAFPHVSNVVGSVNPVAEITRMVHGVGAKVCVDGVAFVAHGLPDLQALDVDVYLFSLYKLYGPHLALLYAKPDVVEASANQNHFFLDGEAIKKLNPGGTNYESAACLSGIVDYFEAVYRHHFKEGANDLRSRVAKVFALFAEQEHETVAPLIDYLAKHPRIRLMGRAESDPARRAPTVTFTVEGKKSEALAEALWSQGIAMGWGHFYARRCVEGLGVDPEEGVLRLSLAHYNTKAEVARVIAVLDQLV